MSALRISRTLSASRVRWLSEHDRPARGCGLWSPTIRRKHNTTTQTNIRRERATTLRFVCGNKIQAGWGNSEMHTWIHMHKKKWLSAWVKAFIAQYYLMVLNCVWKSRSQDDRILEVKDVWRKVEEEDQVIYDCYSIPSNQLIALLPFLCPAVNTLSQLLTLYYSSSLLLTPLFICSFFFDFSLGLSRLLPRDVCLPPGA